MSLWSYLNTDSSSSTTTSSAKLQLAQALQAAKLPEEKGGTSTVATTTGTVASSVSITVEAKRAAATKEDAAKSASALAAELRASFDQQYAAAGKKNSANLTALSGRALATIALNETSQFSKAEIAAAKLELRARDRQSTISALASSDLTAASLKTYSRDLLAARALLSGEEQRLRANNPGLR
jgi:hypothetical protein